ncbi:8901_t:CDS:1 [Cetraspora pellucida]|uniref:8901_t:CDS:1 n=1 Tax=Cetraspora pellucida TaxID=1433469 RepID=A0A9N9N855_9GLOM|nr:8901_t:CDS:1 [Cetraspora pellucida]
MTRSMEAMQQIYRRSSESVVTHQASRSIRAKLDDQRRSSETKKSDIVAARRYATYELNWYDHNKSNMKDADCIEGSAQYTKPKFSKSLSQSPITSPMLQERIPAPLNITNSVITKNLERESTYSHVSEQNHPFFGGITITTVQVVKVENDSQKKNNLNISSSLPHKINNNIDKSFKNDVQGYENLHVKIPESLEPQIGLKQNDRLRPRKQRLSTHIVKAKRQSNTGAQAYSKTVVLSSKRSSLGHFNSTYMQKYPGMIPLPSKESVSNKPKKLIRKKLRVLVNSSTCNPTYSNDPTDMENDLPISNNQRGRWLPTSHNVPQLLHASLIPLPQHVKNGSVVHISPKLKQLTRTKSIRRRSSAIVPPTKRRVSQIFRQQLLEQSILMSFNDPQQITKTRHAPRGKQIRKARKGINAKLDHELRRERQKRKTHGKHSGQHIKRNHDSIPYSKNRPKVQSEPKAVNILSIPRILDVDELVKKVDEELRKKENLMPPLPPPRRIVHGLPTPDSVPSTPQTKSNTSSLLASLPDRRSAKSDGIISTEPPPFPTHLTHKAVPFPARQSQNESMRTPSTIDARQSQQNSSMRTPSTIDARQSQQNSSMRTPSTIDARQSQNGSMRTPSTIDTRQSQNKSMRTPSKIDTRQSQNRSMRTPSTIDTRQSQNGSMRTPSTIDTRQSQIALPTKLRMINHHVL